MPTNLTKKRSAVWLHFSTESENHAKCSYCLNTISVSVGATGYLLRHLKTKHPTVITKTANYRQDTTRDEHLPPPSAHLPSTSVSNTSTISSTLPKLCLRRVLQLCLCQVVQLCLFQALQHASKVILVILLLSRNQFH